MSIRPSNMGKMNGGQRLARILVATGDDERGRNGGVSNTGWVCMGGVIIVLCYSRRATNEHLSTLGTDYRSEK